MMALRNGSVTAACGVCGRPLPAGRPRRWCSDGCRQAAWRRRHARLDDQLPPPLPARVARKTRTVYECLECGTRLLGEQRCEACGTFMRRVGVGGLCPCCDEPVAIDELLDS